MRTGGSFVICLFVFFFAIVVVFVLVILYLPSFGFMVSAWCNDGCNAAGGRRVMNMIIQSADPVDQTQYVLPVWQKVFENE